MSSKESMTAEQHDIECLRQMACQSKAVRFFRINNSKLAPFCDACSDRMINSLKKFPQVSFEDGVDEYIIQAIHYD